MVVENSKFKLKLVGDSYTVVNGSQTVVRGSEKTKFSFAIYRDLRRSTVWN